jgi:DNA-directed RNA polymerase specialized sigma24 family protein
MDKKMDKEALEALVRRLKEGDGEAFHTLHDFYAKELRGYIDRLIWFSRLCNQLPQLAEDISQDTWVKVFEASSDLERVNGKLKSDQDWK